MEHERIDFLLSELSGAAKMARTYKSAADFLNLLMIVEEITGKLGEIADDIIEDDAKIKKECL